MRAAEQRVRARAGPLLQTSFAAALAWYLAHDVLGHAQPFFAPIAAAVSLSASHVQRSRRSVQMIAGVLLGIGVSELLHPLLGNSTIAIALVVLVTVLVALALGVGVFAEGMMFVNQAAASAILVIALHKAGTGAERAVDALVGGGVALIIGVGLFPVDPMKLLWSAERRVLGCLREVLRLEPAGGDAARIELSASSRVHSALAALTQARMTARASVRVAPRRLRLRALVDREVARTEYLYLLGGSCVSLLRTALETSADADGGDAAIAELADSLSGLRAVLGDLRDAPRPWSDADVQHEIARLRALEPSPPARAGGEDAVARSATRRVARDLMGLLAADGAPDAVRRSAGSISYLI